ncbi:MULTISPECIES: nucleotidyl transferase AbiEii/AbiGii toxin family protein [unclassified Stenotrophomonas]|uniref:nucleotidyl transferase AbiEii/AbiGii toxin family protein n=1 Tax=unclassified Stenotrophomonas TaxID=196198 RepID=UPI00209C555F|nr:MULTISPECIES: nucleotidyl transferase AbiEii/AbiGii toxin family protein [unclassified Stenotrophomonas]
MKAPKGVRSVDLPNGPWQPLFTRAMSLMENLEARVGEPKPFWTFGGGTVLMFRYDHRSSKDIDIFVPDPQYLGYFTPRLSDEVADLTTNYVEDASSYVKLMFAEGDVDFVASPNLLKDAWEWWNIDGHAVRVEKAEEIIAKKMYHRGQQATARDLFDLCLVIEQNSEALSLAAPFLLRYRTEFLARINARPISLESAFEAIDRRGYTPTLDHCTQVAGDFLLSL